MEVNLVWSAICFKIMTRYTCVFLPRILAFFPAFGGFYSQVRIWPVSYKRVYICAQKSPHICVTNKHVVHGVTESGRIYKRHRIIPSAKKPLHVQDLVLIHCPHSSGGCWLPDNGFVGIRGLSLERLCTLFHKC